jgi:hypothetical protein
LCVLAINLDPPNSASEVARITGVSHPCPAHTLFLFICLFILNVQPLGPWWASRRTAASTGYWYKAGNQCLPFLFPTCIPGQITERPLLPERFAALAPVSLPLIWSSLQGQVLLGAVGAFNWSGGALLYDSRSRRGRFFNQTAADAAGDAQYGYLGEATRVRAGAGGRG